MLAARRVPDVPDVTDAGGLTGGSSLPPEATFRYYLWRWLHHAIYCCCLGTANSLGR